MLNVKEGRMRSVHVSTKVADPKAPSSHAVVFGNMVYTALTTPLYPDGSIAKGDFPKQMRQCLENIKIILTEVGSSLDKVVKVTVVMPRISDFPEMNQIYKEYFKEGSYPARASIEAKMGNPDFLVEIECLAVI